MPIREYMCRACGQQFERLILPSSPAPACAACGATDLERLISAPAVKSEGTHRLALDAARKRDAAQGADLRRTQREYELKHND
jgi:putative FmdB family regulatory protein